MPKVCFYFLLHQPYRLTDFSVLDLDNCDQYFANTTCDQNRDVFLKVADKSYRPMLALLLRLVETVPQFHFSFSCSGVFLEQAQTWAPDVIELLQKLAARPEQVEVLGENYYHSLSALYSPAEFARQVRLHSDAVEEILGVTPRIFRNTEMIYTNDVAAQVANLGFQGILTEGVDKILSNRQKTRVYRSNSDPAIPVLLKHAQLSDDIAFRFSQKSWVSWPLTADKYLRWLHDYHDEEIIGLFMDFETFGEHQWADTGIFEFFADFVHKAATDDHVDFVTPASQLCPSGDRQAWLAQLPVYDVPEPISWADAERDLSAWRSNDLQVDSLRQIYALEPQVLATHNSKIIDDWRRLQTSDHFYYMCTKYFSDGDVHAYFSAYNSPFEAYRRYCIVLADLTDRITTNH
ncbi:glycoside hydrolase family 57 protein [bacterium]|nr:glycoside hydrolase family 57 protein [bacterium]